MKRSPIKRSSSLKRTGFSIGARREPKRKPINKVGKRKKREEAECRAFRNETLARLWCERCGIDCQHPHHMCSRARGTGHPDLHNAEKNGAALCRDCHSLVEDHACENWADYIKDRAWLDAGGRLAEAESA